MTTISNLKINKLTAPNNSISADAIEQNSNKRFVTDAEKTKISNTSGVNSGDETALSIQTKRPLKTINNESLEGSGNISISASALNINSLPSKTNIVDNDVVVIGDSENQFATKKILASQFQSANTNEALTKLSGEVRDDFVSFIDIPIDLSNYQKIIIEINNLQNDSNDVRLRGVVLNEEKSTVSTVYNWSGSNILESGSNTVEYTTTSPNYFPIASERASVGILDSSISNCNLTIQQKTNTLFYIKTDYLYKNINNLFVSGFSNISINSDLKEYTLLDSLYSQSSTYANNVDVSSNQNSLKDNNFSTGAGTISSANQWIMADLGSNIKITKIILASPNDLMPGGWGGGSYTNGCVLQYSRDNLNWISIATLSGFSTGTSQTFEVDISARYIRVFRSSGYVALSEFLLYRSNQIINKLSYIRIYASTGLIKGNFNVYGLKKTNNLKQRTNEIKPLEPLTEKISLTELAPLSVVEYS